jgi:hypothetical protein
MSKKRAHGDGGIEQRGENAWRLRYRAGGKRFAVIAGRIGLLDHLGREPVFLSSRHENNPHCNPHYNSRLAAIVNGRTRTSVDKRS